MNIVFKKKGKKNKTAKRNFQKRRSMISARIRKRITIMFPVLFLNIYFCDILFQIYSKKFQKFLNIPFDRLIGMRVQIACMINFQDSLNNLSATNVERRINGGSRCSNIVDQNVESSLDLPASFAVEDSSINII